MRKSRNLGINQTEKAFGLRNDFMIVMEVLEVFGSGKGHLISKCPFGVIVWTKIPTKEFENYCHGI